MLYVKDFTQNAAVLTPFLRFWLFVQKKRNKGGEKKLAVGRADSRRNPQRKSSRLASVSALTSLHFMRVGHTQVMTPGCPPAVFICLRWGSNPVPLGGLTVPKVLMVPSNPAILSTRPWEPLKYLCHSSL